MLAILHLLGTFGERGDLAVIIVYRIHSFPPVAHVPDVLIGL
jgi:hypothetical protein